MLRSVAGKMMWVGRATVFVVGLSMIAALVLGVASTALAGNLDPLKIGSLKNVATKATALVGKVATGSAFVVKNPSGGSALGLQVNAGQAPLTVNADAGKATNLDADELDGKDSAAFLGGNVVVRTHGESASINDGGYAASFEVRCQPGEVATGGGGDVNRVSDDLQVNIALHKSLPIIEGGKPVGWTIGYTNMQDPPGDIHTRFQTYVLCAPAP